MLCPHHDIKIVQRSNRQSAVAAAAYQSGERLFSEYDQKQKYYAEKRGIVHTEIMLPPHAPPEYAPSPAAAATRPGRRPSPDRKSTRLNSSHSV